MTPMLSFENVNVAIADAPVLRNVSFSLQPGVSAALIGRNGAGKTTTVRTIMGFTKANGTVRLGGEDLGPVPPHRRPWLGLGYAPEDRRLFSAFTVEENILLPGRVAKLSRKRHGEGWNGPIRCCRNLKNWPSVPPDRSRAGKARWWRWAAR